MMYVFSMVLRRVGISCFSAKRTKTQQHSLLVHLNNAGPCSVKALGPGGPASLERIEIHGPALAAAELEKTKEATAALWDQVFRNLQRFCKISRRERG